MSAFVFLLVSTYAWILDIFLTHPRVCTSAASGESRMRPCWEGLVTLTCQVKAPAPPAHTKSNKRLVQTDVAPPSTLCAFIFPTPANPVVIHFLASCALGALVCAFPVRGNAGGNAGGKPTLHLSQIAPKNSWQVFLRLFFLALPQQLMTVTSVAHDRLESWGRGCGFRQRR